MLPLTTSVIGPDQATVSATRCRRKNSSSPACSGLGPAAPVGWPDVMDRSTSSYNTRHNSTAAPNAAPAAIAGARLRFRAVLMTAFAFILGCIPLWTAAGSGAISRRILGTAVIGGMLAASLLAIFLIPVTFDVVETATAWVKQWGKPGKNSGEFNTPHSIAADAQGNVYVADRGNARIQVFDPDGTFLREIRIDVPARADAQPWMGNRPGPQTTGTMQPGSPWAICITPGPHQYLYSADAFPGRIYKLTLDGRVVGMFGRTGRQSKQFGWIHELACPAENTVFAAELLNWRVQKLTLHPDKAD